MPTNVDDSALTDKELEIDWEENTSMDICKGATPMKQAMQMDDGGAIYFVVKTDKDIVKVLRVDPKMEMGNQGFIKSVY